MELNPQKMTRYTLKSSRFIMSLFIVSVMMLGAGCKSKKKAMEAQAAAEKARMEQQAALDKAQREKEEELKRREAEEKAKRDAEAAAVVEPKKKLDMYFEAIANGNVNSSNNNINEALALFASPQTPVLIVISESGGQKDYDRPTTIIDYLNYLKDQKKNMNKIGNLQFDDAGRITEVELIKYK